MPQLIEDEHTLLEAIAADTVRRAEQRERIILVLPGIAAEVTTALSAAGLSIPVFLTIPMSGDSIVTFATPLDPVDHDWNRACELIRGIVGKTVGIENLITREIACTPAGMQTGAADPTDNAGDSDSPRF